MRDSWIVSWNEIPSTIEKILTESGLFSTDGVKEMMMKVDKEVWTVLSYETTEMFFDVSGDSIESDSVMKIVVKRE